MASSFAVDDLIPSITGAIHDDATKLPAALVSCGFFLIASALGLIVSKSPGAILVTWHGSAAACTYYAFLVGTVSFGVVEASFGFWVLPRDLPRWSLTGKVLVYVTLLPLAVVLALWAGVRL